jgi:hypothetical protein
MRWYQELYKNFIGLFKTNNIFELNNTQNNFSEFERNNPISKTSQTFADLPIKTGRSSVPNISNKFFAGLTDYILQPDFEPQTFELLKALSIYNRHIANAMTNVVALANTDYTVELPDELPKNQSKQIKKLFADFDTNYNDKIGIRSFIKTGFETLFYAGVLPCEMVIVGKPYPNTIEKFAILNPTYVKFIYDKETQSFKAVQQVNGFFSQQTGNYTILNPLTFTYAIHRQVEENPYPVPLLLSTLEDLGIQRDMLKNFIAIIKKVGLMGFLQVMIEAPMQTKNENEQQFQARCANYINAAVKEAEVGFSSGIVVGFKGHHDFDFAANNANIQGVEKAFELVNKMLFNGLRTAGAFMGETNATTETFATVLLKIFSAQVVDYQYIMASVLEKAYLTIAQMNGYNLAFAKVKFKPASVTDRLKEAQAEQTELSNIEKKMMLGIIGLQQAAEEAGYEKPTGVTTSPPSAKAANSANPNLSCTSAYHDVNCRCGNVEFVQNNFQTDYGDSYLDKEGNNYYNKISKKFEAAAQKISQSSRQAINNLGNDISQTRFVNTVLLIIYTDWETEFTNLIADEVTNKINKVYDKYRGDKKIFKSATTKANNKRTFADDLKIPDPINDFLDIRLIDYLITSDNLYLGKFMTDPRLVKKFSEWLKDWYVANEGEIGKSKTLDEFYNAFESQLLLEKYKIRRIIDTTMVNARNFANIKYLHQASVKTFRRSEVIDRLTCAHCKKIHGMEFTVQKEITKMEKFVGKNPEQIADESPFAVNIDIDDFDKLSAADIQAKGIGSQALHPHCRGRIEGLV